MRTTIIVLAVLAIVLTVAKAPADYDFTETYWDWVLDDYPKWHYYGDYGEDGQNETPAFLYYIEFGLYLSENTLVEPNVLNMHFLVAAYDEFADIYFDIHPGDTYLEKQIDCGFYSEHGEVYDLILLNTVPEGEGWVVIDEENSWLHRETNTAVEPISLGEVKAIFE